MILSSGASTGLGPVALALALAALAAYLLSALAPRPAALTPTASGGTPLPAAARALRDWRSQALTTGWVLHGALLLLDILGIGRHLPGPRLGFGPVLSLALWLVLAVHIVESRLLPLPAVRRWLGGGGVLAVLLAWGFPGEPTLAASRWAPWHWLLGVGAYALFGAAVLHGLLLDRAERALRPASGTVGRSPVGGEDALPPRAALGIPLLRLERLTFHFVRAGFGVLTLAILAGFAAESPLRMTHKMLFSLLAWGVFAALLVGRRLRGWRGRRATRWLYIGAVLLLLGYAGSRFVTEVLLHRPAVVGAALTAGGLA